MRAMVLQHTAPVRTGPLKLLERIPPGPGAGEVLLRVRACGVCHTDLHTVEGDLPLPGLPVIPGHQVVGVVEAKGAGAGRFRVGQRVGAAWLAATCGSCRFCTSGRENLCKGARFTGYDVDGGYADLMVVREDFAYPLRDDLEDLQAAPLLCAGIIGFRALTLSGVAPGGRLGLYGFGASAHVTIQVARYQGCEVFAFSRSEEHRNLARDMGAVWTGGVRERPPVQLDAAIIFAPAGDLVPLALEGLDRGGRLVLGGIHMSPVPELDYRRHLYYERSVLSVTANTRRDGEEFLNVAAAVPVVTRVTPYRLEEANRALADVKAGRVNGAAVLVL